jgi:predicted metal-dependent phosphoesterase TrpH
MEMLIDLHTHSHHSDGTLAPTELVARAAARNVRVLALTDHDTTAGLAEARTACAGSGIGFVTGVEVTVSWRGQELHVVGLDIDAQSSALQEHLAGIISLRRARISAIRAKLQRYRRLADVDPALLELESHAVPTRTHVARAIAQAGLAESVQDAFDRFLGRGCQGYVPQEWPHLAGAVAAIRAAGGQAVLAHPHRYKLSAGALRNLCGEFRECGGAALETSLPAMSPNDAARLASLAREHELAGSAGSDFHEPGQPWRPLGRFAKLAEGVQPLLPRLRVTSNE